MRRKVMVVMAVVVVGLMVAACGNQGGSEGTTVESTTAGVVEETTTEVDASTEGTTETGTTAKPDAGSETSLGVLMDMLGVVDKDAKGLLGGGEEMKSADGELLIGRTYQASLFGMEAVVNASYDDKEQINAIQVEMSGIQAEDCADKISEETRVTMTKVDAGESGQAVGEWSLEGKLINLYQIDDSISIQIIPVLE